MRHTTHSTHDVTGVTALAPDRSEYLTASGASPGSSEPGNGVNQGVRVGPRPQ